MCIYREEINHIFGLMGEGSLAKGVLLCGANSSGAFMWCCCLFIIHLTLGTPKCPFLESGDMFLSWLTLCPTTLERLNGQIAI